MAHEREEWEKSKANFGGDRKKPEESDEEEDYIGINKEHSNQILKPSKAQTNYTNDSIKESVHKQMHHTQAIVRLHKYSGAEVRAPEKTIPHIEGKIFQLQFGKWANNPPSGQQTTHYMNRETGFN